MRASLPRLRPITALVAVVVAACLVVSAWSALALRSSAEDTDEREAAREAAMEVAQRAAEAFTTYDYQELDRSFDALLAVGTEDFRSNFGQAVDQLRPIIKREKARSTGEVVATALEEGADDASASLLVAMDVTTTNRTSTQGKERRFRLRVQLQQVEGEWRLDEIATVT